MSHLQQTRPPHCRNRLEHTTMSPASTPLLPRLWQPTSTPSHITWKTMRGGSQRGLVGRCAVAVTGKSACSCGARVLEMDVSCEQLFQRLLESGCPCRREDSRRRSSVCCGPSRGTVCFHLGCPFKRLSSCVDHAATKPRQRFG